MGEGAAERKQKAMKEGRENRGKRDKKIKSRRRKRKKKTWGGEANVWRKNKGNAMPSASTESRDWGLISVHLKERQTVNRGSPPQSLWAFWIQEETTGQDECSSKQTTAILGSWVSGLHVWQGHGGAAPETPAQPGPHLCVQHTAASTEWPLLSAFG